MSDILILAPSALHNPNIPKSGSSEVAGLPFRNVYDPDPTKPWFTDDEIENVTVELDFDGFNKPKYAIIHKSNFTETAEINYQDSDASDFSVLINDVSVTPDLYAQDGGTSILVSAVSRTIPLVISNPTGRYQRLLINDPDNPDPRLELGYIHIANPFSIKNCDYGWIDEYEDETVIFDSDGGITYAKPRKKRRVLKGRITLGDLDTRVVARKIMEMGVGFSTFMDMTPFFIDETFDPESTPEWLYGRFRKMSYLSEDIHRGYEADVGKDTSYTTFDFEFEEMEGEELEFVPEYETHSDFVKLSDRTDVFSMILAPREPAFDQGADPLVWENVSGNMWRTPYPYNAEENFSVWGIYQGNVELAHADDTTDCEATEGSWFHDIDAERFAYGHFIDGIDPNDPDSLVQIAPILAYATEAPATRKWAPIFDLSSIKDIIARRVLFEIRLRENGLSSIEESGESAFYGVSIPSLSSVRIINGKVLPWDTSGPLDKFPDRFQWRDTPALLFHGDGGVILDIDEHLYLDQYTSLSTDANDEEMAVQFDSAGAALIQKIPPTQYLNDEMEPLGPKPVLLGPAYRIPAFRLSPRNWGVVGHATDAILGVWVDGEPSEVADYVVIYSAELGHTLIRFDVAPKEEAAVEVWTKRNVDIDGVGGESLQLAGAALRFILNQYGKQKLAELPPTSFADLDTAHAIPLKIYIDAETTIREVVNIWCRSVFAWCRRVTGIWEVYKYDPANLRTPVCDISEDEILSVSKASEGEIIHDRVRVNYWRDGQQPASVFGEHSTAGRLFTVVEELLIDLTYLYAADDSMVIFVNRLRDMFSLMLGADKKAIFMEATGGCLRAHYGDVLTASRSRAIDSSGSWINKKFIVRSIVKDCTSRPGTARMVLVPPIEQDAEPDPSAITIIGTPTTFANESIEITGITTEHTVPAGTDLMIYALVHNCNVSDETGLVTDVEWNTAPLDFVGHSDVPDDLAVKVSIYKLDTPTPGTGDAIASFEDQSDAVAGAIINFSGATQVLNFAYAYKLENKKVEKAIASAVGDLVLSIYGCIKAPADGEESLGPGQVKIFSKRAPFDDNYDSIRACKILGSTKSGNTSVTCSVTEDVNAGTKVLAMVTLRA